jgi:glutamine amidotransferase
MKIQDIHVVVLDYGIGNVKSIQNAFKNIGVTITLSSIPSEILAADALVLPGVGAFSTGMKNLKEKGLIDTIYQFVKTGKPFLGICLGMQMLLDESEEFGITKGLGLIEGKVVKFPLPPNSDVNLPHVSWNEINQPVENRWENTLLEDTLPNSDVYFVHSYVVIPKFASEILSETEYGGVKFCSSVNKNNIFGTQFHPEKSGELGLNMLKKFTEQALKYKLNN